MALAMATLFCLFYSVIFTFGQGANSHNLGSVGNTFYVAFMQNSIQDPETRDPLLIVTTTESEPVTFNVTTFWGGSEKNIEFIVSYGGYIKVPFPADSVYITDSTQRDRAIHVQAEGEKIISVYGVNDDFHSIDGFLALSCDGMTINNFNRYDYVILSAQSQETNPKTVSEFVIIPCEDNTIIDITPSQLVTLGLNDFNTVSFGPSNFIPSGRWESRSDKRPKAGATLLITHDSDLTGTHIRGTRPLVILSGHQCGEVPAGEVACGHIVEQLPPHTAWGNTFFLSPLSSRKSGDFYRIATVYDNTEVNVTCVDGDGSNEETTFIGTLNQTQRQNFAEYLTHEEDEICTEPFQYRYCFLEASNPVAVAQYSQSHSVDEECESKGTPFMVIVPPIVQYRNNYTISNVAGQDGNSLDRYIGISVNVSFFQPDRIIINGSMVEEDASKWNRFYCSGGVLCGYGITIRIGSGTYLIYHEDENAALNVQHYGFQQGTSYGFSGGMQLQPISGTLITCTQPPFCIEELNGTFTVTCTRSLDLMIKTMISITSVDGTAVVPMDYNAVNESEIIYRGGNIQDTEFSFIVEFHASGEGLEFHIEVKALRNAVILTPEIRFRIGSCECPLLTGTPNGMVSWTSLTVGSVANYMCSDGFELVGNMMRTCQSNLMWSGEEPMCRPVCPDMMNPANGIMMMTGTAVGDTATYTCDPGHELVGAPTLTCLGDGQWSDPPPVCQFIVPMPQFEQTMYTVPENDRTVPLCIDIDVNITEAMTYIITTEQKDPAEAEDTDFGRRAFITVDAPEKRGCINFTLLVVDDTVALEGNETFIITIENTSAMAMVNIIDDDVLELMTHDVTVNEGRGTAEVCVELVNEIEGSLSLEYATRDVENGATETDDYVASNGIVNIEHGDIKDCIGIGINDDNDQEPSEDFEVIFTLENIPSLHVVATVTIIDDEEKDCPPGPDRVWNIEWSFGIAGTTVSVPCGPDLIGNATRECFTNMTWGSPDVSKCQSKVIFDLKARADSALSSGNAELVLEVVGDLVQATAAGDRPQLPRDIDTTSGIVDGTLDLLTHNLDQADNDTNTTTPDATAIFEVLDNMLSENNQASFKSLQEMGEEGSQAVLKNTEMFGLYAARVLDQQMGPGQTVNITEDNMALRAQSIAVDENTEYSFPSMTEIAGLSLPNASLANISLPSALLVGRSNVVVASLLFTTLQDLLPKSSTRVGGEVQSLVISSQISVMGNDGKMNNLLEDSPVIIHFQFQLEDIADKTIQCAFWDDAELLSESGWSVEGVITEKITILGDVAIVECSSLHLTSFACLVDVGGAQIQTKALNVVSYIGLSISLTCLLFTIIFFITFGKKLFSSVYNFVHLNLAIALFAGYLIFTVGVELAAGNEIGCKAVAALIQYFFLSAFCWMMCEGVMLYLMLVVVFSTLSKKWWFFLLLGWGAPVVFVVIGLGAVHDEYGVRDSGSGNIKYCWLSSGYGTYAIWTFVAPMLAIIIINVVFLVMVLRSLYKSATTRKEMEGKTQTDIVKHLLKASLILLPLLGLTWVFGLFAVNRNTAVFAWLFTVFNSLQGFFIFFFHVLRNAKMKNTIWKKVSIYSRSKVATLTRSSKVASQNSSSVLEKKRDLARGIEIECENGKRKSKAVTSQESVMYDVETST